MPRLAQEETLTVCELFRSLQGEGTRAGYPCCFVRLIGCDLNCRWCDTRYAVEETGRVMGLGEILTEVEAMGPSLVCLTGGEPLYQKHGATLANRLAESGYTVLVETNGAHDIEPLAAPVIRIMDIKCPSSGMERRNDWHNLGLLRPDDEVKFVIADRADYEYAREITEKHDLPSRCHVLFGAVATQLEPRELADWILFDNLEARLNLQLHKLLWPETARGV